MFNMSFQKNLFFKIFLMDSEEITIYFDNNVFKLMIIGLMVDVLILIKL